MWLNKNTTPATIIKKAKPMSLGNEDVGKSWFLNSSEAVLNANNIFTITEDDIPKRSRYHTYENTLDEDTAHITRTPVEKSVADVQGLMVKDLELTANGKFNQATEGYTPSEMSSWSELEAEAESHANTPLTSGMLYDEAEYICGGVDVEVAVDALVVKVLANASLLRQRKSFISGTRKKKSLEIQALTTIDECVLYEATPYDYLITAEDVLADDTLVEGEAIPRLKNNVKEW